jgi:hypothetical protein
MSAERRRQPRPATSDDGGVGTEESMLHEDDLFLLEEDPTDEPSDLLTIPQVRHHVSHDHRDDELGLRSLLERPEALPVSLWGGAARKGKPRRGLERAA